MGDDNVLDYSGGKRDREKYLELSYILEVYITGFRHGLVACT